MKRIPPILPAILFLLTTTACGPQPPTEEPWTVVQEKAIVFSDGQYADLWKPEFGIWEEYRLPDGQVILQVQEPVGPDNSITAGVESLNDLKEPARQTILDYYEKQGILYNLQAELKKAYEAYGKSKETGEKFQAVTLNQTVSPTACGDEFIAFLTSVTVPAGIQEQEELRLGAVFDRNTGEKLDIWTLFSIPKEEAIENLLDIAGIKEPGLRNEIKAAIKPEYLLFFPENLEICFPKGTLNSQDTAYCLGFSYKELEDLLTLQPFHTEKSHQPQ